MIEGECSAFRRLFAVYDLCVGAPETSFETTATTAFDSGKE